jgi:DNA-directed RNA polymerase specialized sigma24 family protein
MLIFFLSMLETDENKNKFTLLYEKYRKLMFYVANQILKDKYLSEDAVEQTFVRILTIFRMWIVTKLKAILLLWLRTAQSIFIGNEKVIRQYHWTKT